MAKAGEVSSCTRLGEASATVKDRVWVYERSPLTVEKELAVLARNEALKMGGDTVVSIGPPVDGRGEFAVYRCMAR